VKSPSSTPELFRGISRNVALLGGVSFLADVSSEMLYPVIPLFLTAGLGAPVAAVGIIEGAGEATASIVKGASGVWSDRVGKRKPFVIAGYSLSAISKPLFALVGAWWGVLAVRLIDRLGKGVRSTARDALIADSTAPAGRGRAFGFHRSVDQAGGVIGPLLALPILATFEGNYRALFLAAFLPVACGVLLLTLVRDMAPAPRQAVRVDQRTAFPPAFRRLRLAMLVFSLGNSSNQFLLLRAKEMGLSDSAAVALFAVYNLSTVCAAFPSGLLADRWGRRGMLMASLVVFAAAYTGFAFASAAWMAWPLMILYGFYSGASDGLVKAIAVDCVPAESRGAALGSIAMVTGLAAFAASVAAGWIWQVAGSQWAFLMGAAGAASGFVLLTTVRR